MSHAQSRPASDCILREFDMAGVLAGETIKVTTANGSLFWFTKTSANTAGKNADRDRAYGFAVVTTSRGFGQPTRDPMAMSVTRVVKLGHTMKINSGNTSGIIKLERNGNVIFEARR